MISVEDLERLDVRVGTICEVQDIAESEKLVRLRVDFGDHQRTILVGMKQERAAPQEVEGRQALFVLNLAPRKLFGQTPRECCSTSDILTASPQRLLSLSTKSPTARAPGRVL